MERKAVEEAALIADSGFYGWGAGKDRVEGPSVKLAMALVRLWGNCAVEMAPVQETATAWIFSASFIDLETGFTLTRQFRQSKDWQVYGKFDEARKEDIRFQIGQSKATRNVILNAVPVWLVDRAFDAAKGSVKVQMEERIKRDGLAKVQAGAIKALSKFVDEKRILETFGRPTVAALTLEDLVLLAGNIRALEQGTDTVDSMFPIKPAEPKTRGDSVGDAIAAARGTADKGE